MIKRIGLTILFLIAFFAMDTRSDSHYAAQPEAQRPEFVPDEIIVRFQAGVDEFTKDLSRFRVSGTRKKIFNFIPGLEVVKLRRGVSVEEAIDLFEQIPGVLYAEPNYRLHLTAKEKITAIPNDPSFGSLWGLNKINAPGAWNITTGSGDLVVATLDTGVDYTHPDLAANIWRNTDECEPDGVDDDNNGYVDDCHGIDTANNDSDPRDDHTHGTHVAGTIGAVGNNSIGVVGVNWNVKIMACKFFDAFGSATTEDAIECLEYVKMMKERGVNVVATSNSWGGGEFSQSLYEAVDVQRQNGILFIAGAGNGNFFGIGQNNDTAPFYPCSFYLPNIICVAATASNDSKAGFSNFGRRTVHVGAPGVSILSTVPGNSYGSQSGTSMATPHVSGLAALIKAQDPNRDWRAIKNLILTGGNTISSMSNTVTGKRINANGAMTCSSAVVQSRVQPVANTISASPDVPVHLASLNARCASGNGNVNVTVNPGNQTITLRDNGDDSDQAADDGVYSSQWTPEAPGTYTLTFPGNDTVTVNVSNPTIEVTPSSLDFGGVAVGSTKDKSFTVSNTGGGVLAGTATTNEPYTVVSGGTYNLSEGQSQTVTLRFSPTSPETFLASVRLTGGEGATVAVTGNGVVPAGIAMSFDGKVSDRVGQGDAALAPDGNLDGVFTVSLVSGGNRTVSSLNLRRSNPTAGWDTEPNTAWVLGAATTLTGPLLNNPSNGNRVNFQVAQGGSFKIFASDNVGLFSDGATFTLTATFLDGTTAIAAASLPPPPPPPGIAMSFDGKVSDRVGQGDAALAPDGNLDGVFTVSLVSGGNRTVSSLNLRRSNPTAGWDTEPNTAWVLGAATTLTGPLLNNPSNGNRVNFQVAQGGSFKIFASDNVGLFSDGATFTLTATFLDGTTAIAAASLPPPPPPPGIAMSFDGKVSDRVGQGDAALAPDGKLDGVFTVSLVSGGNRTVTSLNLRRSNPTAGWDTEPNTAWVLGAATTLTGPLLNNPSNGNRVNFQVAQGGSFKIFASDNVGLFADGAMFTLTATFQDGTTAIATASLPPPPPPPGIAMSFDGKVSDRVGQGDAALAPDGKLDGVFTVSLVQGGTRTVTSLDLRRTNPTAKWDTQPNTVWVLGAADTLNGPLHNNPSNGTRVNFEVLEGGSFRIFASDNVGLFADGATFTLTVSFADGRTATANATALEVVAGN